MTAPPLFPALVASVLLLVVVLWRYVSLVRVHGACPNTVTVAPVVDRATGAIEDLTRSLRSPMVDHLPVAVFVCDPAITRYVNPAFCRLVGRTVEELEGHPWEDFVVPEDRARGHAAIADNTPESSSTFDHENTWVRGDGSHVRMRWRATPRTGGLLFCTAEDASRPSTPTGPRTRRVLVVDDHAEVRGLIAYVLRQALPDVPVDEAHDGADARRLHAMHRHGAIVCDLMLPDELGSDVLRSLGSPGDVLLSGVAEAAALDAAASACHAVAMRKPVSPEALVCAVRTRLNTIKD